MNTRPPVEPRVFRVHRDARIELGCVSERTELAAPSNDPPELLDDVEDALIVAGFDCNQAERGAKIFDRFFDQAGARRAADHVREILLSISQTKTGKSPEFRAILHIFSPGRTLEDVAAEAGLSKQSVSYHVEKLRPFFDTAPACVEGDVPD